MPRKKTRSFGVLPKARDRQGNILYKVALGLNGEVRRVLPQQLPQAKSSFKQNQRKEKQQ